MATLFLEPGGDADFAVGTRTTSTPRGFWDLNTGTVVTATDFVHGGHIKSIKYAPNVSNYLNGPTNMQASGGRISFYAWFVTLPSTTRAIMNISTSAVNIVVSLRMTSAGVLQLWQGTGAGTYTAQIGTNGATLATGQWYRISIAYTIASTTVNEFRVFVHDDTGASLTGISVTNATITNTAAGVIRLGNREGDSSLDFRTSDHYIDDSNSLTDTGNIWVTAKRPNANGTTNGFTTQIGSGGSGYGSGHSPQVNERPFNEANGWSVVGAGSAVTEEYNIESKSQGDIDISNATIIDWLGWISIKALAGETGNIIIDGASASKAITTSITLFTQIANTSTYPSGTGADIGFQTDTSLTTVSLYECGVLVAYIPPATSIKTINGLAYASVKTVNGLAIASVKTYNGLV